MSRGRLVFWTFLFSFFCKDLFAQNAFKSIPIKSRYIASKLFDCREDSLYEQPPALLVFLHGLGERGEDTARHLTVGFPSMYQHLKGKNVFLLAPQCPIDDFWVNTTWSALNHQMASEPTSALLSVQKTIDELIENGIVNGQRVYLVGLSMGGFGVWEMLCRWPNTFTAAISICAGADTAQIKSAINVPVWIFHGQKDKLVKVSRSTDIFSIITTQNEASRLTIYPNLHHACWEQTLSNPAIYEWLFSIH